MFNSIYSQQNLKLNESLPVPKCISLSTPTQVTFLIDAGPSKSCKMSPLQGVILALVLSYGCAQIHLGQAQLSVTRAKDKTARIDCEASGIQNFRSAVIHWYRHRPGEAPQRILYISPKKVEFDKGNENKFNCEKKPDQPISTLTVNEIAPKDGATYYCAYWDLTVLESHRQPVQKPHSEY
ncbi:papilin-like [Platysternon megacephalum]|uniref:Papilin-like n=1 Tax=Platysternon megacephalum TaxID=55544 RepID=A0A4D9ELA9_9SAUR|nr:papilin-like [Platysternon megacephalum]